MEMSLFDALQEVSDYDLITMVRNALKGDADTLAAILGRTPTIVSHCEWTASNPVDMRVTIAPGAICQLAPVDYQDNGNIAADQTNVYQLGILRNPYIVSINTGGLSTGQTQWVLIQAQFAQIDGIRSDDPTGGVRRYVNLADVTNPYNGPNNNNQPQNTVRYNRLVISTNYGDPATSAPVPPQPSSGCVPLCLVQISSGTTTISQGDIQRASGNVYSNYPNAPIFPGILNSHHSGDAAQAPQIKLDTEVQNRLPAQNMFASSDIGSFMSVLAPYAGNPNGHRAGSTGRMVTTPEGSVTIDAFDVIRDSTSTDVWYCSSSGDAADAVWTKLAGTTSGGGGGGSYTPPAVAAWSVMSNLTGSSAVPVANSPSANGQFFGQQSGQLGFFVPPYPSSGGVGGGTPGFTSLTANVISLQASATYTPSANCVFAFFEVFGGGGGGGGGCASASGENSGQGGGGGGSGGFASGVLPPSEFGSSVSVTIGAGGSGGGANASGGNGGNTVITNSNFTVTALGGTGGTGSTVNIALYNGGEGGNGGSANVTGLTSGKGFTGAAGSSGAEMTGGCGGSTSRGGGGHGGPCQGASAPGNVFGGGGGGGGGAHGPSGPATAGSAGGKGGVYIVEIIAV